jgi:hypothetical protein
MKFLVRNPEGSQLEFGTHDELVIAFNRGEIKGDWAARAGSEEPWRTVAEALGVASTPGPAPPARKFSVGKFLLHVFLGLAIALLLLVGVCLALMR